MLFSHINQPTVLLAAYFQPRERARVSRSAGLYELKGGKGSRKTSATGRKIKVDGFPSDALGFAPNIFFCC
jgi:hypothetical protein